jgi:hypothetical protein
VISMKPLQIWLPALEETVLTDKLSRDLERAQRQWMGETTVWLLPGLEKAVKWGTPERPWSTELAIPAETLDRIDIFHLGDNGYLHGSGRYPRFISACTDKLLDSWLNLPYGSEADGIRLLACPTRARFEVPRFEGDRVYYIEQELELGPGEVIPITNTSLEERTIEGRWPPPGFPLPTISPSGESRQDAGLMVHAGYAGSVPIFESVSAGNKSRCMALLAEWPAPFTDLFLFGGCHDAMLCQSLTKKVTEISLTDPGAALQEALIHSGKFIAGGEAFFKDSWFHPRVNAVSVGDALDQLYLRYSLSFQTIEEACDSQEFQEKMMERVVVRRAIGVQGLFWSLLIEKLEEGLKFRLCERCGRILASRKGKRFCDRQTNLECFRAQGASNRRRERNCSKSKERTSSH